MQKGDRSSSQTVRALLRLRELILGGDLVAGERISELAMVQRIGVSRTPIRMALSRLQDEGLLEPIATGGFAVRAFDERDLYMAIEIRGTLEGLAARLAAERNRTEADFAGLRNCVAAIDRILAGSGIRPENFSDYVKLNERFHALIIGLAASSVLSRQVARSVSLPFASPSAFVRIQASLPEARDLFAIAQDQHRCIVQAIAAGEGARAEALMREHARLAHRNLELALRNQRTRQLVPGASLIRIVAAA